VATTFRVYLNIYVGIRGIDDRLVEAGTALGWAATG
jgi:hypothetical protein